MYHKESISIAISKGIKDSGMDVNILDQIANNCISYQTTMCSGTSFVTGLPGSLAILGTVPADIAQYYFYTLVIMQKLAYITWLT